MDNNTLSIYIHELRNHCLHLQASFDIFNQSIVAQQGNGVLYGGQMLLTSASQIAALLWPTRARARSRGEALRKALGLPEKHALNDRRLSELWERSDEKFEEWIASTKNTQVVFDFVGDPFTIHNEVTEQSIYRAYNPNTNILYFRGIAYNLKAVAAALADVGGRINAAYRQLFPDHARAEDEARRQQMEAAQAAQGAQNQVANDDTSMNLSASFGSTPTSTAAQDDTSDDTTAKKPAAKKATPKKAPAKKAPAKTAAKTAAKKTAEPKKPAAKKPTKAKKPATKKTAAK